MLLARAWDFFIKALISRSLCKVDPGQGLCSKPQI